MNQESNFAKEIVLSFLEFLHYKIKNDKLTLPEADRVARTIEKEIGLRGTIGDFAEFYGQSKNNVKVVINRYLVEKPERIVTYPFSTFNRSIPKSWKDKKDTHK